MGNFDRWCYGLAFAVLGLMPFAAFAEGYFQGQSDGVTVKAYPALNAAGQLCAIREADPVNGIETCTVTGSEPSNPIDTGVYGVNYSYTAENGSSGGGTFQLIFHACPAGEEWNEATQQCGEPAVDCSAHDGQEIERWGESGLGNTINVQGCAYQSSGVGLCVPHLEGWNCFGNYTGTGDPYDIPDGAPELPQESQGECITGESGKAVCADPQQQQCGSFNGHQYCVSPEDVAGCKSTGNLTVICHEEADGSPAPDAPSTDFGAPLAPVQEWQHVADDGGGGTDTHNMAGYIDNGGNAEQDGGGTGGEEGDISSGSSIAGDSDGDGECQPDEDCSGGGPELGEHPDLPTADVTDVSWDSGLASGGSCPSPETFSIPFADGATIEISYQPFCDFAVMIRGFILAAAYFMAAFITLRGVT